MNESKPLRPQKPVFVFSHPRTRSHLLVRLLETHPLIADGILYAFRTADTGGPERRVKDGSIFAAKEVSLEDTFQNCYDKLKEKFEDVRQKGYIPLAKDHIITILSASLVNAELPDAFNETHPTIVDENNDNMEPMHSELSPMYTNPTVLPKSFLASVTPVLTIRHPLRIINSTAGIFFRSLGARVDSPEFLLSSSLKWTRVLYDYCKSAGLDPVIVDGDELVRDTKVQMTKLCALICVDGSLIQYEWNPKGSYTEMNEEMKENIFMQVLYKSTGVVRDEVRINLTLRSFLTFCFGQEQLKTPVLENEMRKWVEEWGEDTAKKLKMLTEKAMEDYEYLSRFRLAHHDQ
ncbi:hypothetical protein L218DRAFT_961927 [Marasmius fiardii PR-910]|nr:hypothetical protein L218DRAFT_961927 [Marasmius fiardii PR-910]